MTRLGPNSVEPEIVLRPCPRRAQVSHRPGMKEAGRIGVSRDDRFDLTQRERVGIANLPASVVPLVRFHAPIQERHSVAISGIEDVVVAVFTTMQPEIRRKSGLNPVFGRHPANVSIRRNQ